MSYHVIIKTLRNTDTFKCVNECLEYRLIKLIKIKHVIKCE